MGGLTLNGNTHVAIGVHCLTFEEWLGEKGEKLRYLHRFTKAQIAEYISHIEYMRCYANTLNNL